MQYKNFGALVNIHGVAKLKALGEVVSLDAKLAQDVIEGGGCILPADEFDAIFTDADEIKNFPTPGHAAKAPIEFLHKRDAALARWYELRAEYQRVEPVAAPVSEVAQELADAD